MCVCQKAELSTFAVACHAPSRGVAGPENASAQEDLQERLPSLREEADSLLGMSVCSRGHRVDGDGGLFKMGPLRASLGRLLLPQTDGSFPEVPDSQTEPGKLVGSRLRCQPSRWPPGWQALQPMEPGHTDQEKQEVHRTTSKAQLSRFFFI